MQLDWLSVVLIMLPLKRHSNASPARTAPVVLMRSKLPTTLAGLGCCIYFATCGGLLNVPCCHEELRFFTQGVVNPASPNSPNSP